MAAKGLGGDWCIGYGNGEKGFGERTRKPVALREWHVEFDRIFINWIPSLAMSISVWHEGSDNIKDLLYILNK